jgi:hypothetical protein
LDQDETLNPKGKGGVMKRWVALVAVFCTVLMAGSGVMAPCCANQLISFTDTKPDSYSSDAQFFMYPNIYVSWTQAVPTTNTSIGVIVSGPGAAVGPGSPPMGYGVVDFWLTNAVGPSATSDNVITSGNFIAPVIQDINNLNTSPMTSLFSGLSLNPGKYYLILQSLYSCAWIGGLSDPSNPLSDALVTTAPGFSEGTIGFVPWESFMGQFSPSADWQADSTPGDHLIYSIEGTAVPLPPTVLLLGSSLLGLVGLRKLRKS